MRTKEQIERANAAKKAKYRANPEKYRAQAMAWRKANIEKSKASQKRRYDKNPAYYRAQSRERAKANPDRVKNAWLLRYYGITLEFYRGLLASQNGVCAICLKVDDYYSLAVDHNHETGNVRGLLCSNCNLALGKFKDSPDLLRKAGEYLEKHGNGSSI